MLTPGSEKKNGDKPETHSRKPKQDFLEDQLLPVFSSLPPPPSPPPPAPLRPSQQHTYLKWASATAVENKASRTADSADVFSSQPARAGECTRDPPRGIKGKQQGNSQAAGTGCQIASSRVSFCHQVLRQSVTIFLKSINTGRGCLKR